MTQNPKHGTSILVNRHELRVRHTEYRLLRAVHPCEVFQGDALPVALKAQGADFELLGDFLAGSSSIVDTQLFLTVAEAGNKAVNHCQAKLGNFQLPVNTN
jgi:hypothetical protein